MTRPVPQSVKDALADAETLRLNSPRGRWNHSIHGRFETSLEKAARNGSDAGLIATNGHRSGDNRRNTPEFLAREAARAAFRAVPGLRDEETK